MSNKATYPFYAHPMGHKRSIQIIKETKAEIKKMESHRPSTPFGRKKIEKDYYFPVTSRPSSSSSLKSFKFEHEDDCCLSARKLSSLGVSKKRATDSGDLKLEPLVTRSVLSSRKSANSHVKSHSQTDVVFPPIAYDEKITDNIKNTENIAKHEVSLQTLDNFLVDSHNYVINTDPNNLEQDTFKGDYVSSLNAEEAETELYTEDSSVDELSQELKHIIFVLDKNIKLGKRKNEEEIIPIVCKLYGILKEKNDFQSMNYHRTSILKLLFKLLDSNYPVLSLYTIKLLLEMKVKDKNLSNVFRLILRLISNHHVKLAEYDLNEPLLKCIHEMSPEGCKESVLHGVIVLKTLLFRNKLEEDYLEKSAHILLHLLKLFNDMSPSTEQRCDDIYIDMNKQIFITLHYLTENDDVWKILSNVNNLSQILKSLGFFYQNSDIIQIVVRLISKIIDKEDGCQALAQCPENLVKVFSLILQTHKYIVDITLQTTFIIGNLILVDNGVAESFLILHNLHGTLIQILEDYVKEHIEMKRTISNMFKLDQGDSAGWRHDVFEVISRILCIFANICLNAEVGHFLAQENDVILHFLNIIGVYLKQETVHDTNLPIYSFLVVIGNISYYLPTESGSVLKIAKRVIPLLDDRFSLEVRRESANIIQNLTRSPELRTYIQEYSLLPAFVKLLSEDDKEFNAAAFGIIMNLLLDRSNHALFYKEQGITRILHKLHLCTDRDWKTSSILCQILWNYCKCLDEDTIPISKIEAQHLIKYLSYSTSVNENLEGESNDFYLWKNEFCPVAKKLLQLLQSKNSSVI